MTGLRICLTCRHRLTYACACQRPKCRLQRPEHDAGKGCPQWTAKTPADG
jgi:hypothetical protein